MKEIKYIPTNLSDSFRTVSGCECKDKFTYNRNGNTQTANKECVLNDNNVSWCETKNKCGRKKFINNKPIYWDKCVNEKKAAIFEKDIRFGKDYFSNNLLGILFFIVIFVLLIPYVLFKFKFYNFLEVYMPNFDLLATSLSFQNTLFGIRYFNELYNDESENILGYSSSILINYLSLLALTYLISRRVKETKSLEKGWAFGIVMIILTYLIPNNFIKNAQNRVADLIHSKLSETYVNELLGDNNKRNLFIILSNGLIIFVGLFISFLFIMLERFLLINHKKWLDPFVYKLTKLTD